MAFRVVLVGRATDRDRLRSELAESGLEFVGEAATLAAAREAGWDADAFLMAAPDDDDEEETTELVEPLTPRELEVLELMAEGLANKTIATRLGISDQTVKFHVASVSGKLGATNRTDAVRRAVRRGLVVL
jgi:DNA-binding NarL/FixJ family response regulator